MRADSSARRSRTSHGPGALYGRRSVRRADEAFDRGEKWSAYRCVSTLTDYLLVSQGTARVEHYRRSADTDDSWHYRVVESGGLLHLSNGGTLSVDAIYEGAFDVPGDAPRPPDARTGNDSSA